MRSGVRLACQPKRASCISGQFQGANAVGGCRFGPHSRRLQTLEKNPARPPLVQETRCRPCPAEMFRRLRPEHKASSGRPKEIFRLRQRSEEHTSELQSHSDLVCRLLLEKKKKYST